MSAADGSLCVICGNAARQVFRATVLGRHEASYWHCAACGHLRTPSPPWLSEAYTDAISRADTGLVLRNLDLWRKVACVLYSLYDRQGRYLDTAGGTGLFTRLMRDIGFDFRWEDPYCANVMAPGFEAAGSGEPFEAVTAFEVLEHLTNPLEFVQTMVGRSATGTLIFSTELFEGPPPPIDWWYYAFETGQHISFFTERTLGEIARRLGLQFRSAYGLHLFTRREVSAWRYRRIVRSAGRGGFERVRAKMVSLTDSDHRLMLRRAAGKQAQ